MVGSRPGARAALTDLMHNDNGEAVIMQGDDSTIEEWRPIEGIPDYDISDHGRVRSWKQAWAGQPKAMVGFTSEKGYFSVTFRIEGHVVRRLAHRLVLAAFAGPCPTGMECLHGDGNPANNRLENLRWGTPKENGADMVRHGRSPRGEKNGQARLTEADVVEIRAERARHVTLRVLAARFGVAKSTISVVASGHRWGHVGQPDPVMNTGHLAPKTQVAASATLENQICRI